MKIIFKKLILEMSLVCGVFLYSTSPIYGMDTDREQKKHQHLKAQVKGKDHKSTISSFSSLENRIKAKNSLKEIEVFELFLQKLGESLYSPHSMETHNEEIWRKAGEPSFFSILHNFGWLARKECDKDSPEEFKKRFKEIFPKNQYDWLLEPSRAFYWWERAQSTNDAEAQCAIGTHYCAGHGVEKDYEKGRFWLEKAANKNNPLAQVYMGRFCRKFEKEEEALDWFLKAADQNYVDAFFNIGRLYEYDGAMYNPKEAMKWYLKAAEQGHSNAQYDVAEKYYYGFGAPKDYAKAMEWYLKLAEKNYAQAYIAIGALYEVGKGGIKQNSEEASKWFNQAIAKDIKYAKKIGDMYKEGRLVDPFITNITIDSTKALKWYLKAAEQNNTEAQIEVGILYEAGKGTEQSSVKAEHWFTKAVSQDIKYAYNVGNIYDYGEYGVRRNRLKALEWYLKAGNQNCERAQTIICELYEEGSEIARKAIKWVMGITESTHIHLAIKNFDYGQKGHIRQIYMKFFQEYLKAAEEGEHFVQFQVGKLYEKGTEIEQDSEKAEEWFIKAVTQEPYYAEMLGDYFYKGTARDWGKALKWYRTAALSEKGQERMERIDMYLY